MATDEKGIIQLFNIGAERMLGYTADDVLNKIAPAEISDSQEVIARAFALSRELSANSWRVRREIFAISFTGESGRAYVGLQCWDD